MSRPQRSLVAPRLFLWNRIVVPALNLACRAGSVTLTSPSGGVEIHLCEGWCQAFKIVAGGHANMGFGQSRFFTTVRAYERHLRSEGRFTEADELLRFQSTWDEV